MGSYLPTDPLLIFPYSTLYLAGDGLTHSLGCLAVCFSQSEELAGDGRPGSGQSQRGYLLLSQVASPAVTMDLAPSRQPLSPWSQLSPGSVNNLVCHCSPLKGSDLLLLISGLPHHSFHPFSSSKTFLSSSQY